MAPNLRTAAANTAAAATRLTLLNAERSKGICLLAMIAWVAASGFLKTSNEVQCSLG
jgi:hypothetical protein